jgi:2-desacetyl-2-hydroxyethyl bacteriochlorophyllide A dehydrogenase
MLSKKVVFKGYREVAVEEEDVPKPSAGQVLIRTLVSLISTGTELTVLGEEFPRGSVWEMVARARGNSNPGYSNCGIIEETGEGVEEFKVGDRVLSFIGHAEYVVAEARRVLAKVPDGISDEEASFGTLAATAMNGVRLAHISLGDCIVIVGVGLVGQLTSQFSRLCGGFPIVAVDLSQKRLEIAKKLGATVTLNPETDNVKEEILSLTKGRGADIVFEVTGDPKIIPWALSLVRPGIKTFPPGSDFSRNVLGRYIQLSSPRGLTTIDFHDEVHFPSRIIIGAHSSSSPEFETSYNTWTMRRNVELFFDLVKAGMVNVKDLITGLFPLSEAPAIYRMLLNPTRDRLKVMGLLFDYRK